MSESLALVTGAQGFIGSWVVRALAKHGIPVRAGFHQVRRWQPRATAAGAVTVPLDLLDRSSLLRALEGVEQVYHFAALTDPKASAERHFRVNVEGTRNLWECAATQGVRGALYCSSVAVYGLLTRTDGSVTEESPARAVEPYGRSKRMGEMAALEVGKANALPTVVIRPGFVIGPGDRQRLRFTLLDADISRFLLARALGAGRFNFVHVQDVAEAAIHVLRTRGCAGEAFNVLVDQPITFEAAYESCLRVLKRHRLPVLRARLLGKVSEALQRMRVPGAILAAPGGKRGLGAWRPEFRLTYSSQKLMKTAFRFRWDDFEVALSSCMSSDETVA